MFLLSNMFASLQNTFFTVEPQDSGGKLSCSDGGAVGVTPYTLFLKVPCVKNQLASSDFTLRKR
jgi:hypothetical protein